MTAVFTSYWSNPELADVDATIISISRGEPRWRLPFAYRRLRELAPTDEVWREQNTARFEAAYVAQLEALGAQRIVADLERIGGGRPVVCLCWEKPATDSYCHRWTLAAFLEQETGITIPELRAGDLPQRPDSPQPSLLEELTREERG